MLFLFNWLLDEERKTVNSACGGNILNKTPNAAWEVFSELSEGSRQFSKSGHARGVLAIKRTCAWSASD